MSSGSDILEGGSDPLVTDDAAVEGVQPTQEPADLASEDVITLEGPSQEQPVEVDIDLTSREAEPVEKKVPLQQIDPIPKEESAPVEEKFVGNGVVEEEVETEEVKARPSFSTVVRMFRYATAFDWFLMFLGTITGIAHGAALPAFTVVFGRFINIFVDQAVTNSPAVRAVVNGTIDCEAIDPFLMGPNVSFPCPFNATPGATVATMLAGCNFNCLDNEEFIQRVNILVYVFLGIAVGVFTLAYFEISLFQTACERQVKKIRLAFYRAVMRQEMGWFDANPSGELSSRISDDVDKIHDGIGDKVGLIIQWTATCVGGFVAAFVTDWRLTLLLLVFVPFLIIAGGLMAKLTTSFTSEEQKQYAGAGAAAQEVLASIRTVVAFGGEAKECERYDNSLKQARRIGAKKGLIGGLSIGFVFFLFFSLDGVAFWFGGFLIQEGIIQGGDVLTVFFAVLVGGFALGQAFPNIETLLTAAGAADTIFKVIDRQSLIDSSSEEGEKPDAFEGTVELKDVVFHYPTRPEITVMNGLTLSVAKGKTLALVGPSGCGKSTVVQLIQRFYDPSVGEVLVGGKDVRSLNIKWLRRNIGVVSQEPVLFDTTIAKNILYGNEGASEEEMIQAAKDSNAHNFISELPDGYNTLVGEAGTQLSGGQKQRIAIARALVRDPKILLLDEATSALDTESEAIVQQALDHARAGRTTIVIAHRLSTIQNADVIASVENGKIVEQGTHAELMDKGGLYYELVTAQSYGADEQFSRDIGSPQRLLSHRSSVKRVHSDSESSQLPVEKQLSRQMSIKRQASSVEGSKADQEKKQEEWDKDIPEVSLLRVIRMNSQEWWIIVIGLLAALINGMTFPSFSLFFGEVLEVFTRPRDEVLGAIHPWAALFIALGIISGVFNCLKVVCFTVSGENLTSRLRSVAFKAMLRQEIGWFDEERNSTGALTTRLADDAAKVQGATGTRLGTLLETGVSMLMAVIIAFVYSWVLTLLIVAVVPIVLISSALEVKALSGHTAANKKSLEKAGKVAVDSISNIRTVASLSLEESFYIQYKENVEIPYRKALFNCVVYGVTYAFSQAVIFAMYAVVFRFGGFQITVDESNVASASFDEIIVVFFALVFGAAGAGQAGAFAPNYAKAKLSANRIFHLLDREPVIDTYSTDGLQLSKVRGEISTTVLKFNYPSRPDVPVLQGLDISVKPGQTLALVGPSGCGKSTTVSLLERFYNPTSGSLSLDDTNIADLNISWLRQQIGIVSQEPVLFDRSIADNIRYGANYREVSSEEVIEAAKAANIHNFVESLPQGYNTNVGAKGTQISGGQKQRVAIARALVRDPKILLLDEATSALDTESEKIVQEALDKARKGRTSIVIAHRLSTIYNSDCIVVISGGKAIEQGTHAELMAKKGLYYKLNKFQVVEAGGAVEKD